MGRLDTRGYLIARSAEDWPLGVRGNVEGKVAVLDRRIWLLAAKEVPDFSQTQPRKALESTVYVPAVGINEFGRRY